MSTWEDFNQGFLIGLQLSDKPIIGYNKGDKLKIKNVGYNSNNPYYRTILQ